MLTKIVGAVLTLAVLLALSAHTAPDPEARGPVPDDPETALGLLGFQEADPEGWYAPSVDFLFRRGALSPEHGFSPEEPVSRAVFFYVLWRCAGSPAPAEDVLFSDVPPGGWYGEAAAWARGRGLEAAEDGFRPEDPVTWEEGIGLLHRLADRPAEEDAWRWAQGYGLPDGLYPENGTALTSAAASVLLERFWRLAGQ